MTLMYLSDFLLFIGMDLLVILYNWVSHDGVITILTT